MLYVNGVIKYVLFSYLASACCYVLKITLVNGLLRVHLLLHTIPLFEYTTHSGIHRPCSQTPGPVDPRAQFVSLVGGVFPGIVGFRVPGVLKLELACYRQEQDPAGLREGSSLHGRVLLLLSALWWAELGLDPVVGLAMSRGLSRDSCGS